MRQENRNALSSIRVTDAKMLQPKVQGTV